MKTVCWVLFSELRREFLLWYAYRANAISTVVMWAVAFPILLLTVRHVAVTNGTPFDETAMAASTVGFLMWRFCMTVFAAIPEMVEEEAQMGVLENVMLTTRLPLTALFGCRIIARSVRSLVETVILGLITTWLFHISLPWSGTAVIVILLTWLGATAIGFGLAGVALVHKSINSVVGIITTLSLFISGAAVPLNNLGEVFAALKLLFPMTWGIDLLRAVLLSREPFSSLLATGKLPGFILHSTALLFIGYYLFHYNLKQARASGVLGTY